MCMLTPRQNIKIADLRVLGEGLQTNFNSLGAKNGIEIISSGENGNFGGTGTKIFIAPDCNVGLLAPNMIREGVWGR